MSDDQHTADEIWAMVAWERRALADQMRVVPDDAWDHPTRCGAWRVREVVAHLSGLPGPLETVVGLVQAHGHVDSFIDSWTRGHSTGAPSELLALLEAGIEERRIAPGVPPSGALTEVLVHGDDIRAALTIPDPEGRPSAHTATALRFAVGSRSVFRGRSRVAGLALSADDIDWHHGSGTDSVHGPALAILAAVLGRVGVSNELTGAGATTLATRGG